MGHLRSLPTQRSHPLKVADQKRARSILYGGTHHVAEIFKPTFPPARSPGCTERSAATTCPPCERTSRPRLRTGGLSPARRYDLALAVHEVAGNSLTAGAIVKTWCATSVGGRDEWVIVGEGGAVQLMKVWPFGVALRGEASNRLMLRRS